LFRERLFEEVKGHNKGRAFVTSVVKKREELVSLVSVNVVYEAIKK
jgi:hypothetical protein